MKRRRIDPNVWERIDSAETPSEQLAILREEVDKLVGKLEPTAAAERPLARRKWRPKTDRQLLEENNRLLRAAETRRQAAIYGKLRFW